MFLFKTKTLCIFPEVKQVKINSFCTDCDQPPDITGGSYDGEVSGRSYTTNDVVAFTCESDFSSLPVNNQIVCGESGWIDTATCIQSLLTFSTVCIHIIFEKYLLIFSVHKLTNTYPG